MYVSISSLWCRGNEALIFAGKLGRQWGTECVNSSTVVSRQHGAAPVARAGGERAARGARAARAGARAHVERRHAADAARLRHGRVRGRRGRPRLLAAGQPLLYTTLIDNTCYHKNIATFMCT